MATTKDVAAYILTRMNRTLTTYQLQKLSFYSQAWYLVAHSRPLVNEPFRAFEDGPVAYDLYDRLRRTKWVRTLPSGDATSLLQHEREVIDSVIDFYGHLSGDELSFRTHEEAPWKVTWDRLKESVFASDVIDQSLMEDFYREQYVSTTDHPRLPTTARTFVSAQVFDRLLAEIDEPDDNSAFMRSLASTSSQTA